MKREKPFLYIGIEVFVRELEAKTLIALDAAISGFKVIIAHNSFFEKLALGSFPKGICLEKDAQIKPYMKKLVKQGFLFVCQDEEHGLLSKSYDRFIISRSTKESVALATLILCWGNHDYSSWIRYYPEASNKILKIGSPRVDLWRADFKDYYRESIDAKREKFGKFILISSNSVLANSYLTIDTYIAQGRKNKSIISKEDVDIFFKSYEYAKKMLERLSTLIEYLAIKLPDVNFIIRPHPAERNEYWQERFKNKRNVFVIFEGTINSWLRAAIGLIHEGCTTGIEAYIAGVPSIAFNPFPNPSERSIPDRLSTSCKTDDEVYDNIKEMLEGKFSFPYKTEDNNLLVSNRLCNLTDDTASNKITKEIGKLNPPRSSKKLTTINLILVEMKYQMLKIMEYIQRLFYLLRKTPSMIPTLTIKQIKRTLGMESSLEAKKKSGVEFTYMEQVKKNLEYSFPKYKNVKIVRLFNNTYTLSTVE